MAKKTPQSADADDLLDDVPAAKPGKKTAAAVPAKKAAAKKAAEPEPAKKTGKKAAPVEDDDDEADAKPAARVREPLEWEEGEKDEVAKAVKKFAKKPINSRDLAEKCGTTTRKLRTVLYSMQAEGTVTLESGASRVQGMTVTLA